MAHASQLFEDDEKERETGRASDEELRHISGITENDGADTDRDPLADVREGEAGGNLYNAGGDSDSETEDDDDESEDSEEGQSLFNSQDEAPRGLKKVRGKMGSLARSRKKLIIGGIAGGGSIGIIILLLILIASAFKIPDLAQNITSYEFARLTRQFGQSAENTTEEVLAADTTDDGSTTSAYAQITDEYADDTSKVNNIWSKLNAYRPSKVLSTLGTDKQGLQLNYDGARLESVTLSGVTYSVEKQGASRFVPLLSKVINFKNNVQFVQGFEPALDTALGANDSGTIIEALTAREARQQLGISLAAWNLGKYLGDDGTQARLQEEKDKIQKIDEENKSAEPTTGVEKKAVDDELTEAADAEASPSLLQSVIDNGGYLKSAQTTLNNVLDQTGFRDALGVIDPIYSAAVPVCIIFDGSVDHSASTIDNNTTAQQSAYYYVASASDQEKQGPPSNDLAPGLDNAVDATNDDLGDIDDSNAIVRAGGGSIDTSAGTSAEAGADGSFTLLNAIPGIGQYLSDLNPLVNSACPALTSTKLAIGLGIGNILVGIATFGSSTADEEVAGEAAATAVNEEAASIAGDVAGSVIGKDAAQQASGSATSRLAKLLYGTGKDAIANAGKIAGITLLAKVIVAERANQVNSGFSQGNDLANMADSGGNIHANELSRSQNFGRPLTDSELVSSDQTDQQYVDAQNETKSFTQRYFAVSNANSLISHLAFDVSGQFHTSLLSSIINLGTAIMKPLTSIGYIFGTITGKAHAAPDPSTQDYGNVQFGLSPDEQALVDSNSSYLPLENQQALDTMGVVDTCPASPTSGECAIAAKYAVCFGYTYDATGDGSLDPTDANGDLKLALGPGMAGSLGTLLSSGDIVRATNGDIINGPSQSDSTQPYSGLCSPGNLTYTNNGYGPQMVFRWRLEMQYDTTLQQLTEESAINNNTSATSASSNGASSVDQTAEAYAKEILTNQNIDLAGDYVSQDVQAAATGQPGSAGVLTSAAILDLIDTVGATHKVVVTAIQSDGMGHCNDTPKSACPNDPHYVGDAVDFGALDGQSLTGRDAGSLTIMNIAESLLPTGSGFGQSECGTTPTLPTGWITFTDTCNHLHVQVPAGTP